MLLCTSVLCEIIIIPPNLTFLMQLIGSIPTIENCTTTQLRGAPSTWIWWTSGAICPHKVLTLQNEVYHAHHMFLCELYELNTAFTRENLLILSNNARLGWTRPVNLWISISAIVQHQLHKHQHHKYQLHEHKLHQNQLQIQC